MTDAGRPLVSILVPVRGEATRIERCLEAVLAQDWPAAQLEVVVVDGAPGDGTAEAAAAVLARHPEVAAAIVPNPGGGRSANLNRALAEAHGEVACRVDARAALPPGYVRTCAAVLADPAVAVVGGSQVTVAPEPGAHGAGLARGLNNRFAMGMAQYRRRGPSGPSDTVYLGAFRTAELRAVDGWDEALAVNEDFDLNRRLGAEGLVWFSADLPVAYHPRDSLSEIARQYRGFGGWKVRYLRRSGSRLRPRQMVGLAVAPVALGAAVAVAASRHPGRWAALGAAVALTAEHLGATGATGDGVAPGGPSVRLWSLATCATLVGSWSLGAWRELLGPTGRRSSGG